MVATWVFVILPTVLLHVFEIFHDENNRSGKEKENLDSFIHVHIQTVQVSACTMNKSFLYRECQGVHQCPRNRVKRLEPLPQLSILGRCHKRWSCPLSLSHCLFLCEMGHCELREALCMDTGGDMKAYTGSFMVWPEVSLGNLQQHTGCQVE